MNEEYKNQIEALLFASGRLMSAETLMNLTGVSSRQVITNNISKLKEEYDARESPMMIVEEKDGWKLTVREKHLQMVRKIVSETELPKTILETLAVIAWKAPVLQSEIIDIRHNKAYDHIAELEELEFIKKEPKGRSQLIKLTEKFYNYFDVEGAKDIREVFNKVVGKQGQSKVEDYTVKQEQQPLASGAIIKAEDNVNVEKQEAKAEVKAEEKPAETKQDEAKTDAKDDSVVSMPDPEQANVLTNQPIKKENGEDDDETDEFSELDDAPE